MKKAIYAIITAAAFLSFPGQAIEVNKEASIRDTQTSILGINHIGLSVKNLDAALQFYQRATGFEVVQRSRIEPNASTDALYGGENIGFERAVLKAPNMLFELIEFDINKATKETKMLAVGPGMTHTCFQSPSNESGYNKFIKAGATRVSRGQEPVDLGGYGVTYAYVHDPEGNMVELEQLDGTVLARAGYDQVWQELGESLWMSQVAFATHDLERFMAFYQKVLGIDPYRVAELQDNPKADDIAGEDNVHMLGGWFRMNKNSKVIEIWQFLNPITPEHEAKRAVTDLGYSFSLEVADIKAEVLRLQELGVEFVSEPQQLGGFMQAYAHDIDGNVFALRQVLDTDSEYSVRKMDAR